MQARLSFWVWSASGQKSSGLSRQTPALARRAVCTRAQGVPKKEILFSGLEHSDILRSRPTARPTCAPSRLHQGTGVSPRKVLFERFGAKRHNKSKRRPKPPFNEKTVGTRERERSLPASPSFLWSQ